MSSPNRSSRPSAADGESAHRTGITRRTALGGALGGAFTLAFPFRGLADPAIGGWSRDGDVLRFDCVYYNTAADLRTPIGGRATVVKPDSIFAGIGGAPYRFSLQDLRRALDAAAQGRRVSLEAREPAGLAPFTVGVKGSGARLDLPGAAVEMPLARVKAVLEAAAL